jgi:hypothetical protein
LFTPEIEVRYNRAVERANDGFLVTCSTLEISLPGA